MESDVEINEVLLLSVQDLELKTNFFLQMNLEVQNDWK
jgi:hypothetical protein